MKLKKIGKFSIIFINFFMWGILSSTAQVYSDKELLTPQLLAHYDVDELEAVEKAIQEDPNNADAYLKRGIIRSHSQEDFTGAIEDFTKAIRLQPEAETYNYRGTAYFWLQKYQKAIEDYEQAIALDPVLAIAYYNRAYAQLELGNTSKAIEDFRKGATLSEQQGDSISHQQALQLIEDLEEEN
ncbi:MAG: tetratricopeptide repeat protein [Cyanobacteria bacterium P01_G01_bin.49]